METGKCLNLGNCNRKHLSNSGPTLLNQIQKRTSKHIWKDSCHTMYQSLASEKSSRGDSKSKSWGPSVDGRSPLVSRQGVEGNPSWNVLAKCAKGLGGRSRGMNQYEQVACGYRSKIAVLGNVFSLSSSNLTVDMLDPVMSAHICSVMRKTTAPHRSRPHPAKLLAMWMDLLSSLATSAYRISCCQQEFGRYCSE